MSDRSGLRGCRILLWALACFFFIQQGFGLLLDYVVPWTRFPFLERHLATLGRRMSPPEIICVGSSRTGCAIDDRGVTQALRGQLGRNDVQVFNAAVAGADAVTVERVVDRLLAHGHRPRLLVVEALPESLRGCSTSGQLNVARQLTWTDLHQHWRMLLDTRVVMHVVRGRLLPAYAYRRAMSETLSAAQAPVPRRDTAEVYTEFGWANNIVTNGADDAVDERVRDGCHLVRRNLAR